ncbi:MAG: hypothetical protein ACQEWV_29985 [Bacillota bacterium]
MILKNNMHFRGQENITHLDTCVTGLCVSVNDVKKVDKELLENLGAAGVLEVGNNIQVRLLSFNFHEKSYH